MQQVLDLKKKLIKKAKNADAKSKQTLLACNITKSSFKKKKLIVIIEASILLASMRIF